MSRYDLPDPKCHHNATVRVSSHRDLDGARLLEEDVASAYCCDRPACREDAGEWVRAIARHDAVIVPLHQASAA